MLQIESIFLPLIAVLGMAQIVAAKEEELVYGGVFRKDCFDFISSEEQCLQSSVIKAMGYGIVVIAFILKLPQLTKIIKSGSVKGLSKFGAYAELMSYFNRMSYATHMGFGLHIYGEVILIFF